MELFVLSPILFPLLGMLINATRGKKLGERNVGIIATSMAGAAFFMSLLLFFMMESAPTHRLLVEIGPWINAGSFHVPWGFQIDGLSGLWMLIITGVGTLIHLFSIGYMHGDERFPRFFVYLNLFLASMLVLVMGNNYLLMFMGWELVGACSYFLIGFWYTNIKNPEAARKAFVANRIGDVAFVIGLMLIFITTGSLTFDSVFKFVEENQAAVAGVAGITTLCLFLGATGKSAQLPLFVWLPDAMAGPTPVSALIHAATMVTAGLYMMARSHVLFELAPSTQNFVALVGAVTALLAGLIALTQNDIKKVLAYSTVSQLGFMVAAAGMGAYVASVFHVFTHAFFKALLFLAAGSVIHGMEHLRHEHDDAHGSTLTAHSSVDPQDMRNMGGLKDKMPLTFWTFLIGGLALAGVPPLAGFWSKDEIMVAAANKNILVFVLLTITAVLTAFYTGRQIVMVFLGKPRTADAEHAAESAPTMTVPLMALAAFAAIAGFFNFPVNGGGGLHHLLESVIKEEALGFNVILALLFTVLAVGALWLANTIYKNAYEKADSPDPLTRLGSFYTWSFNKFKVDELYQMLFIKPFYAFSSLFAQVFDLGGIDGAVNGIGNLVRRTSEKMRGVQTGFVRSYGLVMLAGVIVIVAYFVGNVANVK